MMSYISDGDVSNLPEVFQYALRQAVLPAGDAAVHPWRGAEEITYYGDGPMGPINKLLDLTRRQNRVEPLRKEVAELVKQKPEWQAGKAMLAIMDLQLGRVEAARKAWTELLDDKRVAMPAVVRAVLARELEHYSVVEDLYIRTIAEGIDDILIEPNMEFGESPVGKLARLYARSGRKEESRALVLKSLKGANDPWDQGYGAFRRIQAALGVAQFFMEEETPVEAVRVYNDLLAEKETLIAADRYFGQNMQESIEIQMRQSIKAMKAGNLPASLRSLVEPRPLSAANKEVLDLVLLVESRDLAKAKLTGMLATALEASAKKPELLAEAVKTLEGLAAKHPSDFSVQIAAALGAFAESKAERIDAALARVVKLMEATPLEPLPGKTKANSRQRAEALKQVGLWLVAKECLKSDKLRPAGEKLATRSVAAGKRMLDPLQAQAMLREWGQLDTERGDTKAAEARWSELLDSVLPPPAKTKPVTEGKVSAPAAAPMPKAVPAEEPEEKLPQAFHSRIRGFLPLPRFGGEGRGEGVETATTPDSAAAIFAMLAILQVPAPPIAAPALAPAAASSGATPVITDDQFGRAMQLARIAADKKMFDFSLKAVKEALRGGPPIPSPNENMRGRRGAYTMMTSSGQMIVDYDSDGLGMEVSVREMIALWRKNSVPVAEIYQVLLVAVLPDARPAEIFMHEHMAGQRYSNGAIDLEGPRHASLAAMLVDVAIEAKQVDDLRKRIKTRLGQPLGELNARIMLMELALRAKDHREALQLVKDLGECLQKDTLQTTANLVAATLQPALKQPELAAAVLPVLDKAAANLVAGQQQHQAQELLIQVAEHHLQKKDEAAARKTFKQIEDLSQRATRQGDNFRLQQAQRLAPIYLREGWLPEALEVLGHFADAQLTRTANQNHHNEIVLSEMPLLVMALQRQPAAKRYEFLKAWTFPTNAKALRYAAGALPTDIPPPAFGTFAIVPGAIVSTGTLLLAAAKEAGKLDELAAELDKLAEAKIENAATLRLLAHLTRGQQAAMEPALRERVKEVRERADAKPNNTPRRYYSAEDEEGRQVPGIRHADYLIAQLAAPDPKTAPIAEEMFRVLLRHAQAQHDIGMNIHVRRELIQVEARRQQLSDYRPTTGLAKWRGLEPRSLWTAQDGTLCHLDSEGDGLLFDYPLTGTFEFTVEGYQGGWAEGHAGYGGIVFEPNRAGVPSSVWCIGRYDQVQRQIANIRNEAFNKLTIQVSPGKVRCLMNGELFYEDLDPAPTSPWLMLWAGAGRSPVFRNFTLTGKPEIPKEVKLTHGSYLEGWRPMNGQVPSRMAKKEPRQPNQNGLIYRGGGISSVVQDDIEQPEPVYDWVAKDGELLGRVSDSPGPVAVPSSLSYFRPLQSGEKIRFEFYYKQGAFHVHPTLGRLAFLFEPDGVKTRWLLPNGQDWTGLKSDNLIDDPASRKGPKELPLKLDAFNTVQLGIGKDDVLSIELNGTLVFEWKLSSELERTFGLLHYQDKSAARVKNVVLTGNWPEKLASLDEAGFAGAGGTTPADVRLRRRLIGERGFGDNEDEILKQVRPLPAAERYAKLADWVLPSEAKPRFNLHGKPAPFDGSNSPGSLPTGRRLFVDGKFEAPVIELIAAAKEASKLDELLLRLQQNKLAEVSTQTYRCRLGLIAAIRSAQGNDEQARDALQKLLPLVKGLPLDAAIDRRRWPELIACLHTMHRPALQKETLALLDVMNRRTANQGLIAAEDHYEQQTELGTVSMRHARLPEGAGCCRCRRNRARPLRQRSRFAALVAGRRRARLDARPGIARPALGRARWNDPPLSGAPGRFLLLQRAAARRL